MNPYAEMIQNDADEMMKNGVLLRKTNKFYNAATILYVGLFLFYAIAMAILSLTTPSASATTLFLDSIILKPIVAFCGFMSCYKKNNVFVVAAFAAQFVSVLLCSSTGTFLDYLVGYAATGIGFNTLLLILVIALGILTFINNRNYQYLKEQVGFPHFNERRTNQDFDKRQREIKDEYQQNFDRLKKTATDEMSDISKATPNDLMSKKNQDSEMEMDSI